MAVVAIEVPSVVVLPVYFLMHTSALWADVSTSVFGFYDKVNRCVLGWKSPCEFKVIHNPLYLLIAIQR